jgi:hypothetical protein
MTSTNKIVRIVNTIVVVAFAVENHWLTEWVILERMAHCTGDVSKNYPDKYGFKASKFTAFAPKEPKSQAISSVGQPN